MKPKSSDCLFQAREDDLLVQRLEDEVLIYDLKRHKAHCLNQTAALVWEHCNGQNSTEDIAREVGKQVGTPIDRDVVCLALNQLDRARLLERTSSISPPPSISRRELLKRAGLAAAISLPLITSVMSPTPAQAATCTKSGQTCSSSLQCCSKVCIGGKCV